jgi:hypothetical protein
MRRLLVFGIGMLLLGACSSSKITKTPVPWGNYPPGIQIRIDDEFDRKDCNALRSELRAKDQSNEEQRANIGTGNALLIAYIENHLVKAGCSMPKPTLSIPVASAAFPNKKIVAPGASTPRAAKAVEPLVENASATGQVVNILEPWPKGNLSIRSKPGVGAIELGLAANGEVMDVSASVVGWFKVQNRRTQVVGWVSGKYFDLCPCSLPVVTDPDPEVLTPDQGDFVDEGEPNPELESDEELPGESIGFFELPKGDEAEFRYEITNYGSGEGDHGGDLLTVSYWIRSLVSGNRFRDEWQVDCGASSARYLLTERLDTTGNILSTHTSTSKDLKAITASSPNNVILTHNCP